MWALAERGNAVDLYMTAALPLPQTVVEHGLTSICGGFSVNYFDSVTGKTSSIVGPLGPAEAELYDFERQSPVTQTGRAVPVPEFLSGLNGAHVQHGKLKWNTLFEPAIKYANERFPASPLLVGATGPKAAIHGCWATEKCTHAESVKRRIKTLNRSRGLIDFSGARNWRAFVLSRGSKSNVPIDLLRSWRRMGGGNRLIKRLPVT